MANDAFMDHAAFTCRVRELTDDLKITAGEKAMKINYQNTPKLQNKGDKPDPLKATRRWEDNRRLKVAFINISENEKELRTRILWHMNSWSEICNVLFIAEQDPAKALVRISRDVPDKPGVDRDFWSYLGTDIIQLEKKPVVPTMNLGNINFDTPEPLFRRAVRHLTGHVLGFEHEHLLPAVIDLIDRDKASGFFKNSPRNWDDKTMTETLFTPLADNYGATAPIPQLHSIMCHPLHSGFMKDGAQPITGGMDFTDFDRDKASKVYPLKVPGWKEIDRHPAAVDIIATNGFLYQIRSDYSIWRYNPFIGFGEGEGEGWMELKELSADERSLTIAADGATLYRITYSKTLQLHHPSITGWITILNPCSTTDKLVAGGGRLYTYDFRGTVKRWSGHGDGEDQWEILPKKLPAISQLVVDSNRVFALVPGSGIHFYLEKQKEWQVIDPTGDTIELIVSSGHLYQRRTGGEIWLFKGYKINIDQKDLQNYELGRYWELRCTDINAIQVIADGGLLVRRHSYGRIFFSMGYLKEDDVIKDWRELDNRDWKKLDGRMDTRTIAVGGGNLYQLRNNGAIMMYTGNGTSQEDD